LRSTFHRQWDIEHRFPGDLRQGKGSQVLRTSHHIHIQDLKGKVFADDCAGRRGIDGAQFGAAQRILLDSNRCSQADAHLIGVAGNIEQHEYVRSKEASKSS